VRSPALLVLPVALVAVACGSSSSSSSTTTKALSPASSVAAAHGGFTTLATQRLSIIGAVLTNGNGRTLYVFTPEKGGKVVCTGGCASTWPPLLLGSRPKPTATSRIHPDLIGTVPNPAGGTIVTYAGWPLHTYASDTAPRQANGQGIGGKWYVISPSGQVITKPIGSATSTTGTSTSSGY
jgi:predicted lipoprotein with Yx(FWY)xxD motif